MTIAEGLRIDATTAADRIVAALRLQVLDTLRRRGAVLGLSGTVESALVAALCAKALGPRRVLGLLLPDRDSPPDSLRLAALVAEQFSIPALVEDLGPSLTAIGCYSRQEAALRSAFPDYGLGWTCKLSLPPLLDLDRPELTQVAVESPEGERRTARLSPEAFRAFMAAASFKPRLRQAMLYHHADRLGYAVAGTSNRVDWEEGFFVKQGDGVADLEPIAHLFKCQVQTLARHLGVPDAVLERPAGAQASEPPLAQEELFFALPSDQLDACLWAFDHDLTAREAAEELGLKPMQLERVFHNLQAKRRDARWQHAPALFVEEPASPAPA